jgi:hypothetical protein
MFLIHYVDSQPIFMHNGLDGLKFAYVLGWILWLRHILNSFRIFFLCSG